jgi:hypothetical protein
MRASHSRDPWPQVSAQAGILCDRYSTACRPSRHSRFERDSFFVFLASLGGASTLFADLIVSRGTFGVDRYTDNGAFLGNVIAPGSGGLSDAQGVAITPSGGYLVGDFTNDNILRFAPDGSFIDVFASGPAIMTPFDVVTGPGGDIFVANAGGLNTVARLNPVTGTVITRTSSRTIRCTQQADHNTSSSARHWR